MSRLILNSIKNFTICPLYLVNHATDCDAVFVNRQSNKREWFVYLNCTKFRIKWPKYDVVM